MLRYMKYAYAVYQTGSFTAAAKSLYISQPALSLTIRKLEQEAGFPIFDRSGKTVTLTPPGKRYIQAVEQIMQIQSNLERELDDMLTLQKGQLSVGCSTLVSTHVLPGVLKKYMELYPGIQPELRVESSRVLNELLESGSIDLVIDNSLQQKPDFVYAPLFQEHILVGVPKSFPINHQLRHACLDPDAIVRKDFASATRVPVSVFSGDPFILLKHGNHMRHSSDAIFREQDMHPRAVFEFDRVDTAISYTECGFGISFVTDLAARRCQNTCFYLPQTQFAQRPVYAMYRKNRYLTQAAREFLRIFTAVAAEK